MPSVTEQSMPARSRTRKWVSAATQIALFRFFPNVNSSVLLTIIRRKQSELIFYIVEY